MLDEEIKEIIKHNQETLESLDERVSKIQSKMKWQTVGNVIKTIFILGPVIIGIVYLSPYVRQYAGIFMPMLKTLRLSPENSIIRMVDLEDGTVSQDKIMENFCDPSTRAQLVEQLCK